MKRKRILFITKGFARYREDLVNGVAEALPSNFELIHTTPSPGRDLWEVDWDVKLASTGPVRHCDFPAINFFSFLAAIWRRICPARPRTADFADWSRIQDIAPDCIVIQEYSRPMILAGIYARLAGIPCLVCSDIGRESDWSQFPKSTRWIHSLGSYLTTGVVAHTLCAKNPPGRKGRPVCLIPHTIRISNLPRYGTRPSKTPVRILMVAQYIPRKGHDYLAKAARRLLDMGTTGFEIRLIGTQDPDWVESVIADQGVGAIVKILGVKKGIDLFQEYGEADIFVLTSRFDTFAVVVHEAAAFGLPLVISRFAASSSVLVEEGENGYVIDPSDTNLLAGRLDQLILDQNLRVRFGEHSRTLAEEFCASKTGEELAAWLVLQVGAS